MRQHKYFGYTLIELLLAVAITGIIGAVGYPSYLQITMEGRRQDAVSALYLAQQNVNKYIATNNAIPTVAQINSSISSSTYSNKNYYALAYCVDNATTPTRYFIVASANTALSPTEKSSAAACSSVAAFSSVQATDTGCIEMILDSRFDSIIPSTCK